MPAFVRDFLVDLLGDHCYGLQLFALNNLWYQKQIHRAVTRIPSRKSYYQLSPILQIIIHMMYINPLFVQLLAWIVPMCVSAKGTPPGMLCKRLSEVALVIAC